MLHIEGFTPCKANSDVWMQCNGSTYEYVAVYVDDLLCAMTDPKHFLDCPIQVHKYIHKGDGPLSFHFNRNMSKSKGWTLQSSLLTLWMDENLSQQSNKNFWPR